MSKIDWSKAPEGATHYADTWKQGMNALWYKKVLGGYSFWSFRSGEWEDSGNINSWFNEHLKEIPSGEFKPFTSIEDAQPEGRKLDGGKVIMGAIPPDAEFAVARVLTFGAEKYARDNWRKVTDMDVRYMDAALRHLNAHRRGESVDSESGESHLAHAACCIMFLLQIEEQSK